MLSGFKIPFLVLFGSGYFNLQVEAPSNSRLVHPSCEKMTFSQQPWQVRGLALIGLAWVICSSMNQSLGQGCTAPSSVRSVSQTHL